MFLEFFYGPKLTPTPDIYNLTYRIATAATVANRLIIGSQLYRSFLLEHV